MLSGPLALCGLMLSSSFWMPGVMMVSGGITGCGLTPLLGMLSIDSVVNTDLNCSFKMFAFCLVSATSNAANYRPISLTCVSCKIMEHVITKHVLNHLESNSLLYDLQHGFRHTRSCETQLLSFVQELAANSDKNIQTDLIIMDG
jgi:hypothetical protein